MRKFFVSLILLVIFCGVSSADIVYTTEEGDLGLIRIYSETSADSPVIKNSIAGTNPIVGAYKGDKEARVFLVDRTDDTSLSGDVLYVFETTDLVEPVNSSDLEGIYNIDSAAFSDNGNSAFFTSGLVIYDFSTETLTERSSYDCEQRISNDIYLPEIKCIATGDRAVYAIINTGTSGDILLRFDGQLKDDIVSFAIYSTEMDTSDIAFLSDSRITVAHSGGVSLFKNGTFTPVISTDYPVKKLCRDNDSGFFYITQHQSEENYVSTLSHYSENGMRFSALTLESANPNVQLLRDDIYETLAVIMDEKIMLYSMESGELIREFNSASLGGVPLNMAACKSTDSSGNESKSKSGCEISFSGIILMLVCAGMISKNKK